MTTGQGIAVVGIWIGTAGISAAAAAAAIMTGDSESMVILLPVAIAAAIATYFVAQ